MDQATRKEIEDVADKCGIVLVTMDDDSILIEDHHKYYSTVYNTSYGWVWASLGDDGRYTAPCFDTAFVRRTGLRYAQAGNPERLAGMAGVVTYDTAVEAIEARFGGQAEAA